MGRYRRNIRGFADVGEQTECPICYEDLDDGTLKVVLRGVPFISRETGETNTPVHAFHAACLTPSVQMTGRLEDPISREMPTNAMEILDGLAHLFNPRTRERVVERVRLWIGGGGGILVTFTIEAIEDIEDNEDPTFSYSYFQKRIPGNTFDDFETAFDESVGPMVAELYNEDREYTISEPDLANHYLSEETFRVARAVGGALTVSTQSEARRCEDELRSRGWIQVPQPHHH